jgi:type IV pilus assembly protein PilY1
VPPNKNGWYIDLPLSGERANTDPQLAAGMIVFTTNIPDNDPCSLYGGKSWINFVDYETGGSVASNSLVSAFLGNALASRATLLAIQIPDGNPNHKSGLVSMVTLSDSTTHTNDIPTKSVLPTPKRISWRQLVNP